TLTMGVRWRCLRTAFQARSMSCGDTNARWLARAPTRRGEGGGVGIGLGRLDSLAIGPVGVLRALACCVGVPSSIQAPLDVASSYRATREPSTSDWRKTRRDGVRRTVRD